MPAEFGMQFANQFAEQLAVPSHEFREKQSGNRGVTLRQIEAGADAAALFAADQDVLFEHQLANVFETDGDFVKLAAEFRGELVNQLGYGKSFGNIAGEFSRARQVPNKQGENLVGGDERAIAVD